MFRRINDKKPSASMNSSPFKLIMLERLEPRILLSGDGLLSITALAPLEDAFLDGTQQMVQYVDLQETNEQIEEQVSSDSPEAYHYQPILTLSVDDGNVSGVADVSGGDVGNKSALTQVAQTNLSGEVTSSPAFPTEDGGMPINTNDADLSIEYATSIEIRGPPAGTTEYSTASNINTYATSDGFTETSNDEGVHQLTTPYLPGLQLANPDISSWNGQIIYLDFDGEQDVTYNGPVIIGPFDVPAFAVPGNLSGQEESIISDVVEALNQIFADSGVVFTIDQPTADQTYSTVYIGGGDSAFAEYGSFLGLAEQVDVGNKNRCDEAFVFSYGLSLQQIVSVISHELGHLLGYKHDGQTGGTEEMSLADVAVVTFTLDQTILELPENTDTASRINVAEIEVNGEVLVTNNLSLGGDDAALFEIDPASVVGSGSSILYLKAGAVLDFETNPVLDVTVNVDDSDPETSPDDTADLSITITDVNEPPTVALINTATILSENTDTTNPIKVADIVVTDDGLGTNILSLSGADASLFHIEGAELFLNAGVTLSHEVDLEVYLNDPSCAAYWRFEQGALGSDSVGTNHLGVVGAQANTSDFIEGEASAEFSGSADRLSCPDSGLDPGFPMKSDGVNKDITTIQWIKFSELGPTVNEFWGKYKDGNVVYRLSAYDDGMIRISSGYEGGFVNQEGGWFPTPVETDRWYFIASTYQHSDRSYRVQIYDYTADDFLDDDLTGNFEHDIDVGDVGDGFFVLSYASPTFSFKGLMDACIVFNRALSVEELEDIRLGMFGGGNAALEVTVEVDDPTVGSTPDDTASLSITITAVEVSAAPALLAIGNKIIDEGDLLTFTASATGIDVQANALTFSLDSGAPVGASIDPVTGIFTWTPGEDQGPDVYPVTVRVTDDGSPNLDDEETITITVNLPEWTELTYDDFETGWGNYTDGGGDCNLYTGGTYAHQGSNAANIQDNSGTSSSFDLTDGIDVDTPGYTQIEVDFWFYAKGMESGKGFTIQYYDGASWQTVASYTSGTDFENGQFYHQTLYIDEGSYVFPTDMKVRILRDASDNRDDIYIDEVRVSAR